MFKIIQKRAVGPDTWLMKIVAPRVAQYAQPGQFVIVIIDQKGERIPLTICDFDRSEGWVDIVFQVVGNSTRKMAHLHEGEAFADFVGPLGQPSEFAGMALEELQNRHFIFVAGGVGAAPIYAQLKWLSSHGIPADMILGARTRDLLILLPEIEAVSNQVFIATNDGSAGEKGFVTDTLKRLTLEHPGYYTDCIAIGPMIMMKSVAELTRTIGLKTIVSLNMLMIDGTGMCGACRVSVGNQTKFTCVDGPEFDAHLVNFDEAMRRQTMYKKEEVEPHTCTIDRAVKESHQQ